MTSKSTISFLAMVLLGSAYYLQGAGGCPRKGSEPSDRPRHSFTCSGGNDTKGSMTTATQQVDNCQKDAGTLFLPRPQGLNSAALFNPFYYECSRENPCVSLNIGYRYTQTFKSSHIARCLFGSDNLRFVGSQSSRQGATNLLADNFGLAPNFDGILQFHPTIKNNIIDITGRVELSSWNDCLDGAYLAFNATVANSSWNLHPCAHEVKETSTAQTVFNKFPACYMTAAGGITPVQPAGDLATALSGEFLFGDMQSQWRFGRFNFSRKSDSDTKLANIDLIVGYDLLCCDRYHIGGFVKGVAPTGTRPDGRTVFSPIIGNGHHWEAGGGIDAHYNLWSCDNQCLTAYLNGCVTHLFKDTQWRTFDFKNSPRTHVSGLLSRYVLLKEFNDNNLYTGRLINAVNFTTRRVDSSFSVQGDAALRLVYRCNNLAIGVGYNVYGRSKEKLSGPCQSCNEFAKKHFGIKGVNGVCALEFVEGEGLTGQTEGLNLTSSKVRAFANKDLRLRVDNPVEPQSPEPGVQLLNWDSPNAPDTESDQLIKALDSEIDGEPAPVFEKTEDLRIKPIPGQLTHKVFAHVDYKGEDCGWGEFYCGFGGEIEFAQNGSCSICTANQWGVWFRTGAYY